MTPTSASPERDIQNRPKKIGHKSMSISSDAMAWIRQNRLILYPSRLDCFVFQNGVIYIPNIY
jgi:hypothetical protein